MSNARELALLEKWWSDGAKIIPPLSSPTSPKATKFCCCPNRRRYNIKQPKLTTTLHVRNIFVDNDFNFIDDPTLNEDDDNNRNDDNNTPQLTIENTKNYKRAESWPSAKRAHKYNNTNNVNNNNNSSSNKSKLLSEEIERHIEQIQSQLQLQQHDAEETEHDYDNVAEESESNCNSSRVSKKEQLKSIENSEPYRVITAATAAIALQDERLLRHLKSCHNNRNNCLTNEHEGKPNSVSSINTIKQSETTVKRPLKEIGGNDDSSSSDATTTTTAIATNIQQYMPQTTDENEKKYKNFRKQQTNLEPSSPATNEQNLATTTKITKTSPLIQRLSEISESKPSVSKTNFSYNPQQQQEQQQHCSNCQFCFNQNCRNFNRLQYSLLQQQEENCPNKMMTLTTVNNSNNSRTTSRDNSNEGVTATATASTTAVTSTTTTSLPHIAKPQIPGLRINTGTSTASTNMPTTLPLSPNARSNTTPLSPLTTTVIKTTMVKRSPANESTTTAAMPPPTISPALTTAATSASLSFEKSFLQSPTNISRDVCAKENNKPANNKTLTDATAATATTTTTMTSNTTATTTAAVSSALSAPLSVKERIAALVAGNGKCPPPPRHFLVFSSCFF